MLVARGQDGAGTCEHYVKWVVNVPMLLLYTFQKAIYLIWRDPRSPCGTFLFITRPIFMLNACVDQSTTYQVRDTFHARSHTNVECFSLWQNPNKSSACVLPSLAIQQCYSGWVSFGITPKLTHEISSLVSKLHQHVYFIL